MRNQDNRNHANKKKYASHLAWRIHEEADAERVYHQIIKNYYTVSIAEVMMQFVCKKCPQRTLYS